MMITGNIMYRIRQSVETCMFCILQYQPDTTLHQRRAFLSALGLLGSALGVDFYEL